MWKWDGLFSRRGTRSDHWEIEKMGMGTRRNVAEWEEMGGM